MSDVDFMTEMAEQILADNGLDDWEVVDDSLLVCPCGYQIEWDGRCPDGCQSPLRSMGLI